MIKGKIHITLLSNKIDAAVLDGGNKVLLPNDVQHFEATHTASARPFTHAKGSCRVCTKRFIKIEIIATIP